MKKNEDVKEKGKKEYSKPKVKKHENLKDITLLSFDPPVEER